MIHFLSENIILWSGIFYVLLEFENVNPQEQKSKQRENV